MGKIRIMASTVTVFLIFIVLYTICLAKPALAYLDPGSGSMMLQLLFGGIAGVIVIVKFYWKSFVSLFRRKNQKNVTSPHELDK
jgi:hypothetical protein